MLNCPYCNNEIELTWKLYLENAEGIHVCPECNSRSKVSMDSKLDYGIFYTKLLIISILILGPLLYGTIYLFRDLGFGIVVVTIFPILGVGYFAKYLDFLHDKSHKKLIKIS
ncbi:MAG: hypothetical protein ACJAT2_003482 [Bacteriovoracaceae bacterium]|jgi:hypothetical protein